MPRHMRSPILALWNFTVASGCLMVLSAIVLPLTGWSAEGRGGPNIASSSTPTDTHLSERGGQAFLLLKPPRMDRIYQHPQEQSLFRKKLLEKPLKHP